jgi:hypothetical protein
MTQPIKETPFGTGSLSQQFNDRYRATKQNDCVLLVEYEMGGGCCELGFDFMTRLLVARTFSGAGALNITPFSNLDRDVLITMRDKLIDLGGKPPELPTEAPASQATTKRLRL